MKTVIFTDLDGTFLNHDNYSFKEARQALDIIKEKQIPLVFTTSKTRVEVEELQKKVGITEPFIIENGAAIFFPTTYQDFNFDFLTKYENYSIMQLGLKYNEILDFYNAYKKEFKLLGFSDMSIDEVIKYTKLDEHGAKLSKLRDFTEPFIMEDESLLADLKTLASKYHIKIAKGGRFYHFIGENQDKGIAVEKAIKIFSELYNDSIESIGLGDGENDIPMFENVDKAIIIKNHKGEYVDFKSDNLQKSSFKGSKGWNEMVVKNA